MLLFLCFAIQAAERRVTQELSEKQYDLMFEVESLRKLRSELEVIVSSSNHGAHQGDSMQP